MKKKIKLASKKVIREKKFKKIIIILLILLLLLLLLFYVAIKIFFNNGNFSITLDRNLYYSRGLIVYDDPNEKVYKSELWALEPNNFTNISGNWLPDNLDDSNGGSHNGENYLAYTFFVENTGTELAEYWSEIIIESATRNVDDAVRIRVYRNGEEVTYAKVSSNGTPENNTVPFVDDELVARNRVTDFKPGDLDKYTLVIWIEGTDRECTDDLLGGEFQVRMNFNSTYID